MMDPYEELTLYQRPAVLMAAAKLGLFAALKEGPATPSDVAERILAPSDTIKRLLTALRSLHYLSGEGDQFSLNDFSRAFLREGAGGMARLASKEHVFYAAWSRLAEAVLSEKAVLPSFADRLATDFPSVEKFLLALNDLAETSAPGVIRTGAFENSRTILDLGGGAGGYAGELARALPDAQVTLADLPEIIPIAKAHLQRKGMGDRVELVAADFLKEGCCLKGRRFDRVFLSHVLHDFDASTASRIVARAAGLVQAPGKLVILDVLVPDGGHSNAVEALFDLMMLVEVPRGRTHPISDVCRWLETAGMASPKSHKLYFGTLLESERTARA
jgi:ubiquinone/menaquinone biosynthesis C-methylase UbiE